MVSVTEYENGEEKALGVAIFGGEEGEKARRLNGARGR
jgi:hypothetical protein